MKPIKLRMLFVRTRKRGKNMIKSVGKRGKLLLAKRIII